MRTAAALILIAAATMGCARIRVHRTSEAAPAIAGTLEQKHHAVFFGLESVSQDINLAEKCTNGWERITTEQKALQALISTLTLNLYSPWTVKLECSAPKPAPTEDD